MKIQLSLHRMLRKEWLMLGLSVLACLLLFWIPVRADEADDENVLTPVITCSNGVTADQINISYYTFVENNYGAVFNAGDTITLTSEEAIDGIYLCWNNQKVATWTLTLEDGTVQECGQDGYLHEYVKLAHPSKTATITIGADRTQLVKLVALKEGNLPEWVQVWEAPCVSADLLLISTHADDEQLFFGGILPYYGGELGLRVQVAYFCHYWYNLNIREHEKLDGLWAVGIHNYPILGSFDDLDVSEGNLEDAKERYNYNDAVAYMTELIRRFQPQVVIGQDFKGEYGHGAHQLTAAAIADALELTADASQYPESAERYGVWDTPKAYFHLYEENQIDLDCRRPLEHFGGQTVLEVAQNGYLQHRSQQWCWFYVSDEYQYSCGRYGLYRSLVGADTEADLMCNLTDYGTTERIEAEQASIEESIAESIAAAEQASRDAEQAALESSIAASNEAVSQASSEAESLTQNKEQKKAKEHRIIIILGIVAACLLLLVFVWFVLRILVAKRHHRKRKKRNVKQE